MATATLESPELESTTSIQLTMAEQERLLAETAKNKFLEAGVEKKKAQKDLQEWERFFNENGVNPQVYVKRLNPNGSTAVQLTEQVASLPKVAAQKLNTVAKDSPENKFVMQYAQEHKQDGFTLNEIVKAAILARVIPEDTKENRQPIYRIVLEMKNENVLTQAVFQRENSTIYILAA
jgi:hypothetical protein